MHSVNRRKQETSGGQADVMITGATVVTLNPARNMLRNAAVVVQDGRIAAVESEPARVAAWEAKRTIDGTDRVVFPGLVNTHTHMFQTLLKGLGDDLGKKDWVQQMASLSSAYLTEEDCYVAALLGCVEGLRTGTTTVLDYMYAHPHPHLSDAVIRAFRETGIRGVFARSYNNTGVENGLPPEVVRPVDETMEDIERLIETYHGTENGRIQVWVAPNTIWGQTEEGILRGKELAVRYGVGISMHVSETPWELECSLRQFGQRDLPFLDSLGVLGPDFLAVHCVYLDEREVRTLKLRDVRVSHNTIANMYLSAGEAPVPEMLMAGVTVGLGTDGAASNNNMNMVQMLKFTALLHKVMRRDPTVITAEKVLEMATIDGARALNLDAEVGSIEVGKKADLILVDFRAPNTTPNHHPVSTLVYSASGSEVKTVLVDGRVVVDEGRICTVDEGEVLKEATARAQSLARRAGTDHLARREWRSMAV
jgi:5-methylthioadenosine/S-adenosylhomocysteine deaminase